MIRIMEGPFSGACFVGRAVGHNGVKVGDRAGGHATLGVARVEYLGTKLCDDLLCVFQPGLGPRQGGLWAFLNRSPPRCGARNRLIDPATAANGSR